jgi:hypothetical protein
MVASVGHNNAALHVHHHAARFLELAGTCSLCSQLAHQLTVGGVVHLPLMVFGDGYHEKASPGVYGGAPWPASLELHVALQNPALNIEQLDSGRAIL